MHTQSRAAFEAWARTRNPRQIEKALESVKARQAAEQARANGLDPVTGRPVQSADGIDGKVLIPGPKRSEITAGLSESQQRAMHGGLQARQANDRAIAARATAQVTRGQAQRVNSHYAAEKPVGIEGRTIMRVAAVALSALPIIGRPLARGLWKSADANAKKEVQIEPVRRQANDTMRRSHKDSDASRHAQVTALVKQGNSISLAEQSRILAAIAEQQARQSFDQVQTVSQDQGIGRELNLRPGN